MQVRMIGVDYNKADLDTREKFAFTKDEILSSLKIILDNYQVTGAIIISTCNRTELWISQLEEESLDMQKVLCELKNISADDEHKYIKNEIFVTRQGKEAIEHIMVTACGINSKVFGEDQILTQIREALEISREINCTSTTLEKVFLNSVTAGKKVKDSVRLTRDNPSVATSGIKELKEAYGSLEGKDCLIVGNGKMAVLIAEHLIANKANVYMTLRRRYHNSEEQSSNTIKGCKMISYEDRYSYIEKADIVISATLSPHNTITLEGIEGLSLKEPSIWLDLAVPRDIDPRISKKYNITIWDIDNMQEEISEDTQRELLYAKEIIGGYRDEMVKWLEFRKLVPNVNSLLKNIRRDVYLRSEKNLRSIGLDNDMVATVEDIVMEATSKAVSKVLFGLKDTLGEDSWESTFQGLLEASEKDTLKN